MEQPQHLTKNELRVPMCEWCTTFQRSLNASPNCRFGICNNPNSLKYGRTVPVSLPGCSVFNPDTPGIKPLGKRPKDIQDIEELNKNNNL